MSTYGDRFNEAVATELRAQRARVQMTVDSLVEVTGLSKSAVLNYLNGKRIIPTTALADLCRALDVAPTAIFDAAERALQDD